MINIDILVRLAILFPIATGFLCLGTKNHGARAGIVIPTAVVLIATSILLLVKAPLPLQYSPAPVWDWFVLILDYVILGYFLFVGIRDITRRGASRHNVLAIVLTVAAGTPLAIFEFSLAPHIPLEVTPALLIDHLSIIMCLIISIVGSLIAVYSIRYMKDHEEHRIHLGSSRRPTSRGSSSLCLSFSEL